MAYAILRTKKLKTRGNIAGCSAHNHRKGNKAENADPTRRHLNEVLVGTDDALADFDKRLEQSGAKPRNSSTVLGVEVVMTASPEAFKDGLSHDQFRRQAMDWLEKKFGKENVINAVLHLDETTPHIQAVVTPIHEGKFNAKHWLGGKAKLSKLQDSYAEAMKPLNLERGIRGSKAKHTTIQKYYGELSKKHQTPKKTLYKFDEPTLKDVLSANSRASFKEKVKIAFKWSLDKLEKGYQPIVNQAKLARLSERKMKQYQQTAKDAVEALEASKDYDIHCQLLAQLEELQAENEQLKEDTAELREKLEEATKRAEHFKKRKHELHRELERYSPSYSLDYEKR
jgi:hypothetical protein